MRTGFFAPRISARTRAGLATDAAGSSWGSSGSARGAGSVWGVGSAGTTGAGLVSCSTEIVLASASWETVFGPGSIVAGFGSSILAGSTMTRAVSLVVAGPDMDGAGEDVGSTFVSMNTPSGG